MREGWIRRVETEMRKKKRNGWRKIGRKMRRKEMGGRKGDIEGSQRVVEGEVK